MKRYARYATLCNAMHAMGDEEEMNLFFIFYGGGGGWYDLYEVDGGVGKTRMGGGLWKKGGFSIFSLRVRNIDDG